MGIIMGLTRVFSCLSCKILVNLVRSSGNEKIQTTGKRSTVKYAKNTVYFKKPTIDVYGTPEEIIIYANIKGK